MSFSLLGNSAVTGPLTEALRADALSHGYLFSGPAGSGKRTFARELAAAAVCTGGGFPCRTCSQCHKALGGIHPDIVSFAPPEPGKSIPVETIREQICADAAIRPNEGKRKVYIILHAQDLSPQAQNTLLLTLEEPPAYALFLLLCENPEGLLPTVRSRLSEFTFRPVPEREALPDLRRRFPDASDAALQQAFTLSGGILGQAIRRLSEDAVSDDLPALEQLCDAFCARDELLLLRCCVSLERMKRPEFSSFLQNVCLLLRDAAAAKSGRSGQSAFPVLRDHLRAALTLRQILSLYDLTERLRGENEGYVSVSHLCGALCSKGYPILKA